MALAPAQPITDDSIAAPARGRPQHGADDRSWVVVALSGDLNLAATGPLAVLADAVTTNPGARVLVDLSNVTFLGPSALHAFTRAVNQAAATGGMISLHGANDRASRLLQMWHLEPGHSQPDPPEPAA